MASKTQSKRPQGKKLIEIKHHIPGPPRRTPGQRLLLTNKQIKQQGLKRSDFKVIPAR